MTEENQWDKAAIKYCGYHEWMCGSTYGFQRDYRRGYKDGMEKALEILDKYCHTPAYPYIKEEIERNL